MINHGRLSPSFIRASSPSGLRRSMLNLNMKHGAQIQFFDIQNYIEKKKTVWIVWFYIDASIEIAKELLKEVDDDE